jgi:hypothetical protein
MSAELDPSVTVSSLNPPFLLMFIVSRACRQERDRNVSSPTAQFPTGVCKVRTSLVSGCLACVEA